MEPVLNKQVITILKWADNFRRLGVRANADTPTMAAKATSNRVRLIMVILLG